MNGKSTGKHIHRERGQQLEAPAETPRERASGSEPILSEKREWNRG
ncbi:MAG TPA: hypothetical protein IAC31_00525 [Candidatus Faecousia intestinigallinarum]|nr:hypothetical protein [Candidatus Faecousia intestinigallinarum]